MFNTAVNHALQELGGAFFLSFFQAISFLGTTISLVFLLYLLLAGIDFKRGMVVVNIFSYVLLTTLFLKATVDYPRPLAVDATLQSFGEKKTDDLSSAAPVGFWELFSDELLSEIRKGKIGRQGFPSGHTSSLAAILFGSFLVFRRQWLGMLSFLVVGLTMLSRMYLGQHYLADVLAGLVIGIGGALLVFWAWQKASKEESPLATKIFFLSPLALLPAIMHLPAFQLGSFIAFNLSYLVVLKLWGNPIFTNSLVKRITAVLVFFVVGYLNMYIVRRVGLPAYGLLPTLVYFVLNMATFLASAWLCFKAKLWKKPAVLQHQPLKQAAELL